MEVIVRMSREGETEETGGSGWGRKRISCVVPAVTFSSSLSTEGWIAGQHLCLVVSVLHQDQRSCATENNRGSGGIGTLGEWRRSEIAVLWSGKNANWGNNRAVTIRAHVAVHWNLKDVNCGSLGAVWFFCAMFLPHHPFTQKNVWQNCGWSLLTYSAHPWTTPPAYPPPHVGGASPIGSKYWISPKLWLLKGSR